MCRRYYCCFYSRHFECKTSARWRYTGRREIFLEAPPPGRPSSVWRTRPNHASKAIEISSPSPPRSCPRRKPPPEIRNAAHGPDRLGPRPAEQCRPPDAGTAPRKFPRPKAVWLFSKVRVDSFSAFNRLAELGHYFAIDVAIFGLSGLTSNTLVLGVMSKSMSSIGIAPSKTWSPMTKAPAKPMRFLKWISMGPT